LSFTAIRKYSKRKPKGRRRKETDRDDTTKIIIETDNQGHKIWREIDSEGQRKKKTNSEDQRWNH